MSQLLKWTCVNGHENEDRLPMEKPECRGGRRSIRGRNENSFPDYIFCCGVCAEGMVTENPTFPFNNESGDSVDVEVEVSTAHGYKDMKFMRSTRSTRFNGCTVLFYQMESGEEVRISLKEVS
jgi:hypothetical protein